MTKEPIMIDDVDVSGCSLYHNGVCLNYRTDDGYDKCNAVCDYASYELRQTLKAKEQECETLASQLDIEVQKKECLEQECEEWKDTIQLQNKMQEEVCEEKNKEIDLLKAEVEKYKQLANSFEADFYNALSHKESNYVKNLKQALQEIIKITEEQQSWNECNMRYSETESEDDIFAYNWSALNRILQKCEVIKNEEN